jgi:hypothetical protein
MVEKEGALDLRGTGNYQEREAFLREHKVAGLHLPDCFDVADDSYYPLQHIGPAGAVIGQKNYLRFFMYPDPEGPDLNSNRNPIFDHMVDPDSMPKPSFMWTGVKMLEEVVRLDMGKDSVTLGDGKLTPVLWTTNQEVEAAARFFMEHNLVPERTVGLHLTASSYDSFKGMLARAEFLGVTRYLIQHGLTVLLITGTLGEVKLPEERGASGRVHQQFYEELRSEAPGQVELFYGDVLVQAEVMRRCKFFVSPETGPAHVASAVGVPKLTIAVDGFQVDNFLLTGPDDFSFIVPRAQGNPSNLLKLADMIEALEALIHRPYVPHPLFGRHLDEKSLVVSAGKETEVLQFAADHVFEKIGVA